ncbi:MAG: hypothetical protein LQ351_002400 [Letrouitia transgressa]|nr:MAG: hypothetical protein LQ351_002400 [Letrouitia transgressa]
MAPTKTVKSRSSSKKKGQARNLKNLPATKAVLETSKVKRSKLHKTPSALGSVQKKKKIYTDKELGLPKLNMITPAGVNSPKGKKKGKVFADDQESMMTILAIVEATKEGQIESKLKKSRHLEEIREARRKELEAKQGHKNSKLGVFAPEAQEKE